MKKVTIKQQSCHGHEMCSPCHKFAKNVNITGSEDCCDCTYLVWQ